MSFSLALELIVFFRSRYSEIAVPRKRWRISMAG